MSATSYNHPFEERLASSFPPEDWAPFPVVLAVSGGADSVALACAVASIANADAKKQLHIAHFQHGLRPEDAAAECELVQSLAMQNGVTFHTETGNTDTTAQQDGDGLEAAARKLRYVFLAKIAEKTAARYILTAHHCDDQVETVLHHFLRGTSLRGLAGMKRARQLGAATLLRPLLDFSKTEILDYLTAIRQPFCEDPSNKSTAHLRNRLRNEVLPFLEKTMGRDVKTAIRSLQRNAREATEMLEALTHPLLLNNVTRNGEEVLLKVEQLLDKPSYLVQEVIAELFRREGWPLQQMTREKWQRIAEMVGKEMPAEDFPGGIAVRSDVHRLLFRRRRV